MCLRPFFHPTNTGNLYKIHCLHFNNSTEEKTTQVLQKSLKEILALRKYNFTKIIFNIK